MSDDQNKEEFRKAMRKSDSRIKARIDSELLEFRPMYSRLLADEKATLKAWVRDVLAVQEKQPRICMELSLKVWLSEQVGDDEHRVVDLPVKVLLNAMESWGRGEPYAPATIGELWSK